MAVVYFALLSLMNPFVNAKVYLSFLFLEEIPISLMQRSPGSSVVKRWPTDLAVASSSPVEAKSSQT